MTTASSRTCLAASLLLGALLAACSGGGSNGRRLTSIAVTPALPSIAAGTSQQFTAMGTFSNGAVRDLTASVTWSSSNASAATVTLGMAAGLVPGITTISATDPAKGVTGSADLTVTAAVLSSLALTPVLPQLALGTSVQVTATGTFSDNTVQDLTGSVLWTSANAGVFTVMGGLVQSTGVGISAITATDPGTGIDASTTVTVTPAVLSSIAVTPPAPSIALGTTQAFTATGTYTDSTTQDLTATVTWGSTSPSVATVSNTPGSAGLAASVTVGATTVTATDAGSALAGSTVLTVTPAVLSSIAVTPPAPSIALGTTETFTATGTYSDSTTQDLTDAVTWSSTSSAVASVSNAPGSAGLATSLSTGVTTLSATEPGSGVAGSTTLTITPAVLTSLAVTPTTPALALGTAQQFTATGTYSDSTTQDLTEAVTWSSLTPSIASVSNAAGSRGLATSASIGSTLLTATDPASARADSTTLTVTPAVLISVAVGPAAPSIALGTAQALTATGTYSDSTTQDLTDAVTWSSSAPSIASVSNAPGSAGLATSASPGLTTLTATEPGSGLAGATTLTVTPAVLTSIAVTPPAPSIALGTTQQLTATGTYSDRSTQDLTTAVTWSSASPAVATVSNAPGSEGLAASASMGVTALTATAPASAIAGATTLTVTPAVLTSIAVTPAGLSVPVGETRQLTATGTYSDSTTQDLTDAVTWDSTATFVATVSNAGGSKGLATAVSSGSSTVCATDVASGIEGLAALDVIPDISLRGAASAGAAGGTDLTLSTPPGVLANDLLVAAIAVRPSTATITPPGGWTLVRRVDNATGNSSSLALYQRTATAGEPAIHSWSFSTSTGLVGGIAAFYGVDPASAIDVEDGQSTPASLVHATPSVTTTRTRTMLVTAHAFSSSALWTPPGGMTEALENASLAVPNGAGISLELNYALQPVAGATGGKSALAGSGPDTGNAQIQALSPGP